MSLVKRFEVQIGMAVGLLTLIGILIGVGMKAGASEVKVDQVISQYDRLEKRLEQNTEAMEKLTRQVELLNYRLTVLEDRPKNAR